MPLAPLQEKQLREALFAGRKIEAIKIYREAGGGGLKEAKEKVEALEIELRKTNPAAFRNSGTKTGCLGVLVISILLAASALFVIL
jgi:hypothetical protein